MADTVGCGALQHRVVIVDEHRRFAVKTRVFLQRMPEVLMLFGVTVVMRSVHAIKVLNQTSNLVF